MPPSIMPAGLISPAVEQPETGTPGNASRKRSRNWVASCFAEKNAMMCWNGPGPRMARVSATARDVSVAGLAAIAMPLALVAAALLT